MKRYAMDVNTSCTPEEGAYTPSWPNGIVNITIIIMGKEPTAGTAFRLGGVETLTLSARSLI
jgi:hypothetical protein